MPSLLFVCTANICRSPMAAALFKNILSEKGIIEGWSVESAGTWASEGMPAVENTLKLVKLRGIDISNHRSRRIDRDLLESFDLVLTMEKGQKEALKTEFSEHASKIFLLSEVADEYEEIEDPVGLSILEFEDTAKQIEAYLNKGFENILILAKSKPRN